MWVEWTIFKKQLNKKRRVKITVRQMFSNKNNKSTVVATLMYRQNVYSLVLTRTTCTLENYFIISEGKLKTNEKQKIKMKVPSRF